MPKTCPRMPTPWVRVQVLEGSQGALFGRNATVGAGILSRTLPEFTTSDRVDADAGNNSRINAKKEIGG